MKQIRAFIFDLDGTLVSSSLDFPKIKAEIGCPQDQDALAFIDQLAPEQQDRAMAVIHDHEMRDALSCDWMPGARRFVERCAEQGFPMAILTRNSLRCSRVKVEKQQIPIELVVTRECSKPKPDPSALIDIAAQFDLPVEQILMVGDYRYDLEAGRNANMPACLVHFDELPDYAHLADYAFENFSGLHRAVFGTA